MYILAYVDTIKFIVSEIKYKVNKSIQRKINFGKYSKQIHHRLGLAGED